MKDDSILVHSGKDPERHYGIVNLPVYHASTVLYPTIEAFNNRAEGDRKYHAVRYGAYGTPSTYALADSVAALEGGSGSVVTSSGLAAVTMAITAFSGRGDHILVSDSVYDPTRSFCDTVLNRFGVETTYYHPLEGRNISRLFRPNTRLVFCESPGSLTFEVQDVPAIAKAAHEKNVLVLLDNTWATPLFFKPFQHGVDISIQAGTKYISGHSDLVIGIITAATDDLLRQVKDATYAFGDIAGPDDCYLALRGMRTMSARIKQQQAAAQRIAEWFHQRSEIKKVMFPALETDPGHSIWKRDFTGASSLFGVMFETESKESVSGMVEGYRLFKIGASWGGYESLVMPAYPHKNRTAGSWDETGFVLRYHIGLEDPDDLIEDLEDGFNRLGQAVPKI
jgi:cystathionine beta-lyase